MANPYEDTLGNQIGAVLGQRLAALRLSKGYTQHDLAELLQLEPETISRFERGVSLPSLKRLAYIAETLGVGVADLLVGALPVTTDQAHAVSQSLSGLNASDRAKLIEGLLWMSQRLRANAQ